MEPFACRIYLAPEEPYPAGTGPSAQITALMSPEIQASMLQLLQIYPQYYLPSQDLIFKGIHNGGAPTAPGPPANPNLTLTTNLKH